MAAPDDGLYRRMWVAALAVITLAYLAQLPTPLRLHTDTTVLVSIAESVVKGKGFLYRGYPSRYPQGYPAIVALLVKLGMFHVWIAVALNFLFLTMGLWAAARFVPHGRAVILLTLLSFVTVKHATIPLTDVIFFGMTMVCLLLLERERLFAACVLILIAMTIRRNGVALVPPLLWMLYRRRRILAVTAFFAAAATYLLTSTLSDFHETVAGHGFFDSIIQILGFRLKEFGEIVANVPAIALPPLGQAILPWFGAVVLALIAAGVWTRRRCFGPTELFFLGYTAILFVWPYYDPRFWLPVLPLIFGYGALSLDRLVQRGLPEKLLIAYPTVFAVMGALVLGLSVRITYSGSKFPDAYGNALFRPTYCAYYGTCSADPEKIDPEGLHLLRTYK